MNLDTLTKSKAFNWTDLLDTPSSITANEFVRGNGAGTDLVQFDLFAASNIWTAENTFNENLFGLSSIYIGGVIQVDLAGTYNFTANAIAQWKCNDNLATTSVVDSVGSFTGTATTNTNNLSTIGKINEAFNFVSGNSEFIDLGSTSIIGSGNYTILGWFNASSPDDFQRLYTEGNSGDNLQYTSVGFRQDGHIRFTVVNAGTSIGIETSTDYGDGAWHSFMARRSASNDWDLYIDGGTEIVNSTTNVSSPSINQATLGALRRIATENYWNGDIDNVLIINRAIADSEYLSWHDGESEAIFTGAGSVINAIGTASVLCSQKLTDSEKNLLVEGDIEVSNIFFNTVSSKEINGSISILLDNVAGADLIIGNNNALVVEGDNDRVGIGILAPLVPLHLPDNTAIGFGNTANVTIDYDSVLLVGMFDGGNWLMNSTNQLQFGDTGTYINQATDGHLDLTADISVDINAPLTIFRDGEFPVLDKASGNGIKVDSTTPTFGFADILGDQFSKNTGGTKPILTSYNGVINGWLFGAGDEAFISYHIPHDYVAGSDIFLHIHWSHIGTLVTGGTVTFKATSIYAKGHNQAAFQSVPATGTFVGNASTTQYQQILTEAQYSASSPTGIQVDSDLLEPDGVIELTLEVDANNITVSGGGVPDIFVHFVDIHYQSTGLIGTKDKAPDFYN